MDMTLPGAEGTDRTTTTTGAARQAVWLARLAQAGVLTNAGLLTLLHVVQPDLSPVVQPIGEYTLGTSGPLLAAANLALGGGVLALVAALVRADAFAPRNRIGAALLGLWGGGLLVAGVVPTALAQSGAPEPAARLIHGVVELVTYPCIAAALIVIGQRFRRDSRWRDWFLPAALLAGAVVAAGAALILAPVFGGYPTGLPQRLFLVLVLAWLYLTASRLRGIAGSAARAG